MASILVRHKVADYATWKQVYDQHSTTRKANGSLGGKLFRNAHDPNEVVSLLEFDDLGKAQQFAQSDETRETMQRAGIVDQPDVYFLEEVEQVPA